ncbi:DUF5654 family protein [Methanobrevibacter olleyae]|uniref:Uncharacterized protein n=1 Tax=Methanobrevibacter olleyae TaxID=294671 RepID=A0A126R077_METOL|nr:DUF5654 family protein [Methanobrevibacter olleyae]AMK15359.1 hypothetical protein YLM1_0802 [Methanobrevibacter olleyae]SFL70135.1 hypothetical protein SAMN02910297_01548 [Methanobrevibacter olleyae]
MSDVSQTVIKTIITLVTTAFGLVAGLAWNDAIQKLIESVMGAGDALSGLFIYAVVVTIIAVVVTILLARVAAKMGVEIEE